MAFKTMVTELKWFLKGDTNIKYLQDNNCKIWDGDYKKSGRTDGELGPIYGKQWRDWNGIDQLENLIVGLINDPDSRRHLVSAWNVDDLDKMTLPPCHYSFQCYIRGEYLDLMWNQRSADLFLGVPFNIASYSLLNILIAKEIGKTPGVVTGNLGDVHLYNNHIEQAREQISRSPMELPQYKLNYYDIYRGDFNIELIDYKSHPSIKATLSN
jgi:thymidylate synthase